MFTIDGTCKKSIYASDLKWEFVVQCGNRVCQIKLCMEMELLEHNMRMKNTKLLGIPEISLKSSWVDIFAEFEG